MVWKKIVATLSIPIALIIVFSVFYVSSGIIEPYNNQNIKLLRRELSEQVEGFQDLNSFLIKSELCFTCKLDAAMTDQQIRDSIAKTLPLISEMARSQDFQRDLYNKTWKTANGVDFEMNIEKSGLMPYIMVTFQIGNLGSTYSYSYVAHFYHNANIGGSGETWVDYYQTWSEEKLPILPRESVTPGKIP
ncbi:MAG: hypothetical protein FWC62_03740 [Firmicutes bacterium]|nr:hypothetical protein [Bacillota bacterium]